MTGVRFEAISSVRYNIISVEMTVLAATLTAQLFGPVLTTSFYAGFHLCMDIKLSRHFLTFICCSGVTQNSCSLKMLD